MQYVHKMQDERLMDSDVSSSTFNGPLQGEKRGGSPDAEREREREILEMCASMRARDTVTFTESDCNVTNYMKVPLPRLL